MVLMITGNESMKNMEFGFDHGYSDHARRPRMIELIMSSIE